MPDTHFRVHFADGQHFDVLAEDPNAARKEAQGKRPQAVITKIKVVKGK